jgi:hypothetical protein
MKKIYFISLASPILFLLGCSSSPPVIEASVPLIQQPVKSIGKNAIPSELNTIMAEQPQGYSGVYNDVQFTLGKRYFSALGKQCRVIYLIATSTDSVKQQRVVCKETQDSQWSITPQVIDSKNSQIGFGA